MKPASPETATFQDDGVFPNSRVPVLIYRNAFPTGHAAPSSLIEDCFEANGWTDAWRGGVYSFRHYHSTSHEVLGVSQGSATLELGGQGGRSYEVKAGDVLVIPAGVSHQCLKSRDGFQVVGAYPGGGGWDILRGDPGERPLADENIAAVPIPATDPVHGEHGPLKEWWSAQY